MNRAAPTAGLAAQSENKVFKVCDHPPGLQDEQSFPFGPWSSTSERRLRQLHRWGVVELDHWQPCEPQKPRPEERKVTRESKRGREEKSMPEWVGELLKKIMKKYKRQEMAQEDTHSLSVAKDMEQTWDATRFSSHRLQEQLTRLSVDAPPPMR